MSLPLLLALVAVGPPATSIETQTASTATVEDTPDIPPDAIPLVPVTFVDPQTATVALPRPRIMEAEPEPGAPRIESTILTQPEPPLAPPVAPPPPVQQAAPPKVRKLPPEEQIWYGWQNLLLGIGGVVTSIVGVAAESALLTYSGVAIYACGPTAAHWAHGNFEMGFASIGIQLGAPATLALGGAYVGAVASADSDVSVGTVVLVSLVIGAVTSIAIDAAALAWVTEERLEITPVVNVSSDVSSFGIGGTF